VHSYHSITLDEVLRRVWGVIRVHEYRRDLEQSLKGEIEAGIDKCFTGLFTRIINSLSGFVEGVGITISEKERLNGRLAALWEHLPSDGSMSTEQKYQKLCEVERMALESEIPPVEVAVYMEPFANEFEIDLESDLDWKEWRAQKRENPDSN